jgi:hypothetical protein
LGEDLQHALQIFEMQQTIREGLETEAQAEARLAGERLDALDAYYKKKQELQEQATEEFQAREYELQEQGFGREWDLLEQDYEYYKKHVDDKAAVDEWYASMKEELVMRVASAEAASLAENLSTMAQAGMVRGTVAKRAAQLSAIVDAFSAANAAYAAMAGIPIVGPALGAAAAAAALGAGMANVRMIEKQKFEHGGLVRGRGGVDSVLGLLTPDEFVVEPDASRRNRNLLEGLNKGRDIAIPRGTAVSRVQNFNISLNTLDAGTLQEMAEDGSLHQVFQRASNEGYYDTRPEYIEEY